MLQDSNIPWVSPSQFVSDHLIDPPWELHWASRHVLVAGAAMVPLQVLVTASAQPSVKLMETPKIPQSINPEELPVSQLRRIWERAEEAHRGRDGWGNKGLEMSSWKEALHMQAAHSKELLQDNLWAILTSSAEVSETPPLEPDRSCLEALIQASCSWFCSMPTRTQMQRGMTGSLQKSFTLNTMY